MLRIRVARYGNAYACECGKEKASPPHKPHAEKEAFWIVGVLYKANMANNIEKDLKPERSSSIMTVGLFIMCMQQVCKLYQRK